MKKAALLVFIITSCLSCQETSKENKLKTADWLIGTWENKTDNGTLSETWIKVNDSTYSGTSYYIKQKDTLHNEQIVLLQKGKTVQYIPTVKGQNNNQPVVFQLTSQTAKQLVFENPKHDYPQKIVYQQIAADSLVATISGVQQQKPSSESFSMKKQ